MSISEPCTTADLQASFAAVYERHAAAVLGWLITKAKDKPTAEDLAGDVWLSAWRHWAAFDGDPRPWLFTIAERKLVDHWRRKRNEWSLDATVLGEDEPRSFVESVEDGASDMDRLVDQWDRTAQVVQAARGADLDILLRLYWLGDETGYERPGARARVFRFRERLLGADRPTATGRYIKAVRA